MIRLNQNAINPHKIIVCYKTLVNSQPGNYFEIHHISDNVIHAGSPLSKKALKDIISLVSTDEIDSIASSGELFCSKWINHRIIYLQWNDVNKEVMWLEPPMKVHMSFKETLGLKDNFFVIPPTLMHVLNDKMFVYCTREINIQPETQLYEAPYFNTNKSVCIGSGFKGIVFDNKNDISEVMYNYSTMFWSSKFSEVHGNSYSKTIIEMYKNHLGKDEPFPEELLIPYNKKIVNILNKTINQI